MSRYRGGLRGWVWQRFSAVYLALFVCSLLALFLFAPPENHHAWQDLLKQPWLSVAFLLFVVALLVHAWIGFRDVLMDYVHHDSLRLLFSVLLLSLLISSGGWALMLLI
ncbi:MAG: succinate dehydrogenase, hydrophobic membrane anchor protein [Gammaproteobacteria bacterium]|nr:succinate dehydrogenase, hydrophobic membrane anchor protein [Gammaproteobacteria bacterium]